MERISIQKSLFFDFPDTPHTLCGNHPSMVSLYLKERSHYPLIHNSLYHASYESNLQKFEIESELNYAFSCKIKVKSKHWVFKSMILKILENIHKKYGINGKSR